MNLRPWREVAVPHEDVLDGTFQQAESSADLFRVHVARRRHTLCERKGWTDIEQAFVDASIGGS